MTASLGEPVSIGRRISLLAAERPDEVAVVAVAADGRESSATWAELDARSNQVWRLLEEKAAGQGDLVAVGYPGSVEHVVAVVGIWKRGGCVMPLNSRLPAIERDALLDLATPVVVFADWADLPGAIRSDDRLERYSTAQVADAVPEPGRAIPSGGSTGLPKIIVDPNRLTLPPGAYSAQLGVMGFRGGQTLLLASPTYHNFGSGWTMIGLFEGCRIIVLERFRADLVVDIIERHRVGYMPLVPTMMQRMLRLPDIAERDLSSLEGIVHTAAPCPAWAKRGWIDLVGPEKVYEVFGATEAVGICVIRGDEWLERPGSVGRPLRSTARILDDEGRELPPLEVGNIFMRPEGILPTARSTESSYGYLGSAPAATTGDGFVSVGDLGWVDDDGYLYLADRRTDLIITGGSNVYPAQVEAVLTEHPAVADAVVIGLPDDDLGKRVHAIVELVDPTIDDAVLLSHCQQHLSHEKVPRAFERIDRLPRDEAGKIRKSALIAERVA